MNLKHIALHLMMKMVPFVQLSNSAILSGYYPVVNVFTICFLGPASVVADVSSLHTTVNLMMEILDSSEAHCLSLLLDPAMENLACFME